MENIIESNKLIVEFLGWREQCDELFDDHKRKALSTFYLQPEIKELEELTKNLDDNNY